VRTAAALVAGVLLLAGCTSGAHESGPPAPPPPGPPARLDAGLSSPVEDRVYPQVGDPGVDALRYDLDLDWDPDSRTLDAVETIVLRATTDAGRIRLDFGAPLRVTSLRVGGARTTYDHRGKELVVRRQVREDHRYRLVLHYTGTPRPVRAPTQRTDISRLGWNVTRDGEVWTMQEPYGAYSWYAVNDQPSDKALYSFTISAPSPWVGVANGSLLSRREQGDTTVTRWRLDDPASSYLVTVGIGSFVTTRDQSSSGVPISYWAPSDQPELLSRLRAAPSALAWVEDRLGPYPFDSLGFLLVDSRSGMETQTMITLGATRYATSPEVLVHEIAHQWYGDEVTPRDWRDVWMNEGMAMYLQAVWTAEAKDVSLESVMDRYAFLEAPLRKADGPPADYDPDTFGASNIYYGPALMWDELRKRLGDEEFWRLVRAWPRRHADGNADYDDITSWWSARTGQDLSGFFHDWLLGTTTPARG
jgi:aminopeptidase N